MSLTAQIMDEKAVSRAITRICYEIVEKNRGSEGICIVGIYLDITPYRDDVSRDKPIQDRTQLDFDIQDKKVVLVDDVLYTGRSVRAAIDALMARGRPDKIQLAALIDRGHRELPLRPDFIGKNVPTSREEKVIVRLKEADGIDQVTIIKETEETK